MSIAAVFGKIAHIAARTICLACLASAAEAQTLPRSPAPPVTKSEIEGPDMRAQLVPRRYTTLAAEIGARISALPLAEGASFRAGQLLIGFDCAMQSAQLQKAQAELLGAERTFRANSELAKLKSVGQLELDLSEVAVAKAQAEVNMNRAVVTKCQVLAPYSGRIADQKVREQQYVQTGQALLDIIDDSSLELELLVPSRWLVWLRQDGKLSVYIDETGKSYPARLVRIGARADPVSQSVKVAATIDGKFPELVAGMSGQVQVTER